VDTYDGGGVTRNWGTARGGATMGAPRRNCRRKSSADWALIRRYSATGGKGTRRGGVCARRRASGLGGGRGGGVARRRNTHRAPDRAQTRRAWAGSRRPLPKQERDYSPDDSIATARKTQEQEHQSVGETIRGARTSASVCRRPQERMRSW
jgi:hypothetical protein